MSPYTKGDIICPDGHPELCETVIYCDGVRVTSSYETPDGRIDYFTRDVHDIVRYWKVMH